jgi:chromosome segregation ATPase
MAVVLVVVLMAIKSRESSAETGGSTTPAPTTPTKTARAAEGRSTISSGGVQHSARDDIDEERTALSVLAQSLEDRKRALDAEGAKLDKQKRYLTGVESSYSRERVPNGGRSLYEALLADHNDRVNKYNKKLAVFKEDFAAYTERANSLNARIRIFNGSP